MAHAPRKSATLHERTRPLSTSEELAACVEHGDSIA